MKAVNDICVASVDKMEAEIVRVTQIEANDPMFQKVKQVLSYYFKFEIEYQSNSNQFWNSIPEKLYGFFKLFKR